MHRAAALVVILGLLAPAPAAAWGFEAHRFIADRAVALLPAPLRLLFDRHRAVFVERSIDPDTWRTAGFAEESPRHFLNLDADGYGAYPFRELPRDYAAAVRRFGEARVHRNGVLPWRSEDIFDTLRRAFSAYGKRGSSAEFDVVLQAAWLTHYLSDAHVPFHAVANYDGQLTNQVGIHARFETTLFVRYRDRLLVAPVARAPVTSPREFVFDRLLEGTTLVPPILQADRAARGRRADYDDRYYAAFFDATKGILLRRLEDSIAATAAAITGAWEAAGAPTAR